MSQRKVNFVEGEHYHIYNRGNSKQIIFVDNYDRLRFQQLLFVMNSKGSVTFRFVKKDEMYIYERDEQLVAIGAYCLMPNHFHVLLTPVVENGVQIFMQKFLTGYSMYFNKRHERTGSLFEGKFKSEHADTDEYLKYLFSYIHLNPLKLLQSDWKEMGLKNIKGGMQHLKDYSFSSYLDYVGVDRKQSSILSKGYFPDYFPSQDSFNKEIQEWMSYKDLE